VETAPVGAAASATGALAVSAGVGTVAAVVAAATVGVMAVSAAVLIEAAGATAAVSQCSEIIFASVTAKLLSAAPELAVALVLSPIRATL
jgi:phage baseplate assembly protein gpV